MGQVLEQDGCQSGQKPDDQAEALDQSALMDVPGKLQYALLYVAGFAHLVSVFRKKMQT
jgi:hypothetical protein